MDIAIVVKELRKIEDRNGRLTAESVLEAARSPKHPLHGHFEWDDSAAAHHWRIEQARRLIRGVQVQVEVEEHTINTVAYVRDPSVEDGEQGYRSIVKLRHDPDDARSATLAEFAAAESHIRRSRDVGAVLGYSKEIEGLLRRLIRLGERIEQAAPTPA